MGEGALHLLHLAQLSYSISFSVSLGLFGLAMSQSYRLKAKHCCQSLPFSLVLLLHTPASVIHVCWSRLSYPFYHFLFSIPNLPPFLSSKPAQKRLQEVFPLIASANHQLLHVSFLQSNLFCNCDLITRVYVLLCICSVRQKPHLVWCCVHYGC